MDTGLENAKRECHVPRWLTELDKALSELDGAISDVIERTQSVTGQEPPASIKGGTEAPDEYLVPVADMLRSQVRRIQNMSLSLRGLRNRIEL